MTTPATAPSFPFALPGRGSTQDGLPALPWETGPEFALVKLTTVLHELTSPLSALRLELHALHTAQTATAPKTQAATEPSAGPAALGKCLQILTHIERVLAGAHALAALSKDESVRLQAVRVSLPEALHETLCLWRSLMQLPTIEIDLAPGLPLLWADKTLLLEVLSNLLLNAASRPGTQCGVQARLVDDDPRGRDWYVRLPKRPYVAIDIWNTGPGMARAHHSRALTYPIPNRPTGHGLGLYICYRILGLHQGDIWISHGERLVVHLLWPTCHE